MATYSKHFSCLVLLVLSTYCKTEARQSLFFSKYVHLSTNTNKNYVTLHSTNTKRLDLSSCTSPNPAPVSQIFNAPASGPNYKNAPAPAPTMGSNYENAPAPMMGSNYENAPARATVGSYAPAPIESENWYYGLYAKGKSDFVNDQEEEKEEFSNEEFSNGNGEEVNSREETNTDNNGYSDNLSNNNAFWTSNDKSYNTNYNTNYGYDNINNGYRNEPQGMSDTRLVNNGKYYYNTERENYSSNGNELVRENKNEEVYNGNYQRSKYEFDTMEEYEEEEGYVGVEQEFINP